MFICCYAISVIFVCGHVKLIMSICCHMTLVMFKKHAFNETPIVTFKRENNLDDIYWLSAYSFMETNTYVRDVVTDVRKV
jgi:hypothetical protein